MGESSTLNEAIKCRLEHPWQVAQAHPVFHVHSPPHLSTYLFLWLQEHRRNSLWNCCFRALVRLASPHWLSSSISLAFGCVLQKDCGVLMLEKDFTLLSQSFSARLCKVLGSQKLGSIAQLHSFSFIYAPLVIWVLEDFWDGACLFDFGVNFARICLRTLPNRRYRTEPSHILSSVSSGTRGAMSPFGS